MKVKDLFWIVVFGVGAVYAYDKYKSIPVEEATPIRVVTQAEPEQKAEDRSWIKPRDSTPTSNQPVSQFKCDGRTHCSQMRSCAEAEFFLKHCPNTKMDGNRDGEPCEQQWCN